MKGTAPIAYVTPIVSAAEKVRFQVSFLISFPICEGCARQGTPNHLLTPGADELSHETARFIAHAALRDADYAFFTCGDMNGGGKPEKYWKIPRHNSFDKYAGQAAESRDFAVFVSEGT